MARDDILPEILAAAGVCADFCARPEIWPLFEEWLREDGIAPGDEELVSREFLLAVSRVVLMLINQMEAEAIAEKFRLLLSENLWHGSRKLHVRGWKPRSSSPKAA